MKRKRFDKDGNTTPLGKTAAGGTPNVNNVNSLTNNGTATNSIANELNAIYNPVGIQLNVTIDDPLAKDPCSWVEVLYFSRG